MKKILIADDEPHVILLLKQFLERNGYAVKTAANGELALASIAEDMPDALITDVQMPKLDGMQLCEEVTKQYPELKLIIVMTSKTDRQIRAWAENQPVCLTEKPLSMRRLAAQLSDHFGTMTGVLDGY
jgi:two-component system response regulator VicR